MFNWYALEQRIKDQMCKAHVPGLALAIVQGSQIIYARGFGVTSVEDGALPVTPQTLFRIGSTTKALTGTAVMRLVDQGLLDLDRSIKEYLPWLSLSEEGAVDQVTLRLLLSHTAGLPPLGDEHGRRDPAAMEAYVREEVPRLPIIYRPGSVWAYSNPSITLAGTLPW
jgi:CubicO group peptidase (beta-lactamase class C family)